MSKGDRAGQPYIEWTPEQLALHRQLWDAGETGAEIARRLGTTKGSVVGKAHRLNYPPRPSPIKRASGQSPIKHTRAGRDKNVTPGVPSNTRRAPPPEREKLGRAIPEAVKVSKSFDHLPVSAYQCSWPIGHPGGPDTTCPDRALVGKPYCAEHCANAYVKLR